MATGTVSMYTSSPAIGASIDSIVDNLNSFFSSKRIRIFDTIKNVGKASQVEGDTPVIRFMYELIADEPTDSNAGSVYQAKGFGGSVEDVQDAYEAFFSTNDTYKPYKLIDITDIEGGDSESVRLIVIYSDMDDNPYGGHLPNNIFLVIANESISAGAEGSISYVNSDGDVIEAITNTATNADDTTAVAENEITYAVMDPNSNKVLILPSCCGGVVSGSAPASLSGQMIEIIQIPNGNVNDQVAAQVNQFFEKNPSVTVTDVSVRFEQRGADYKYQVVILYDSRGGSRYGAAEFLSGASTADAQAVDFFNSNRNSTAIQSWIISKRASRFNQNTRLLVLYQEQTRAHLSLGPSWIGGIAAEDIATTDTENAKQMSQVSLSPQQYLLSNIGGGTIVSQSPVIACTDLDGGIAGVMCCGSSGSDDVAAIPAAPVGAVCDNSGPPDYPVIEGPGGGDGGGPGGSPPINNPPPGGGNPPPPANGCLIIEHICVCPDDVDTWVLTNVQCVNNALCPVNSNDCDNETSERRIRNACFLGFPVPNPVPDPTCDPICCETPDPPDDCCVHAIYNCVCEEISDGPDEPVWSLDTIECIDNDECEYLSYTESDEDGDDIIDKVEYEEQGACECGEDDQDTLLALLPDDHFGANDDGDIEPTIEADCCPELCCLILRYYCVDDYGESLWEFDSAECVDNDDCSSSGTSPETPIRTCDDNISYEVTLRDACDCDDIGSVTQSDAEEELQDEPQDCDPECVEKDCVYTWESFYDCDANAWMTPEITDRECVDGGTVEETEWDYETDVGRECYATRKTVESDCGCAADSDCPDPEW